VLQESVPALMNPSERCFKLAAQDKRRELEELFRAGGLDKDKKNAQGQTCLIVAAESDACDCVRLLLELGADVNARDTLGRTALLAAALKNSCGAARLLLSVPGVDLEARDFAGRTALLLAVANQAFDAARLLVEAGADVNAGDDRNQTPLFVAAWGCSVSFFEFLVSSGADMHKKDKLNWSALDAAAESDSSEIVEYLLKHTGFTFDEKVNALTRAAQKGFVDSTDVMIRLCGDVYVFSVVALTAACMFDRTDIVHLCMDYNRDVDVRTYTGMTPLMIACYHHSYGAACLLVSYGADVNAADSDGITALMYAASKSDRNLMEFLLNKGADRNVRDLEGKGFEDYASEYDDREFYTMLVDRGFRVPGRQERPDEIPREKQPFCDRFAWYLQKYFERNPNDKNTDIYRRAGLSRQRFSRILSERKPDFRPRKQTVLALVIGLKLTVKEGEDLLRSSGFSFSSRDKTDMMAMQLLANENYNIFDWNEKIFAKTGRIFFEALCAKNDKGEADE